MYFSQYIFPFYNAASLTASWIQHHPLTALLKIHLPPKKEVLHAFNTLVFHLLVSPFKFLAFHLI